MSIRKEEYFNELIRALQLAGKDGAMLRAFLYDLLTPAERQELSARLQIIEQLNEGVSQTEIAKNLKVGVATVTRGARTLLNPKGGFNRILEKRGSWRPSVQRASAA